MKDKRTGIMALVGLALFAAWIILRPAGVELFGAGDLAALPRDEPIAIATLSEEVAEGRLCLVGPYRTDIAGESGMDRVFAAYLDPQIGVPEDAVAFLWRDGRRDAVELIGRDRADLLAETEATPRLERSDCVDIATGMILVRSDDPMRIAIGSPAGAIGE